MTRYAGKTLKVLILGSEGFVGKNLVGGLQDSHQILTADVLENGSNKNYTRVDITDYESVQAAVRDVDVVINLVAHTLVSSLNEVIINAKINIIGLLNILEACRENKIEKIIFTSASSMIGEPNVFKVSESHQITPKTAYGITKMTSEHYLRLYNEMHGINYVIFRFFNIYGPYQKNGLIPTLYKRISAGQPITIFGKGDQIRDYVYIEDVIPFFEKVISANTVNNQIFNIGTGVGTSIMDIVNYFSKILNIKVNIDYQPSRSGEIGNFVADTSLLFSTFGSVPKTSIEGGLQKTIAWLQTS